MDKQTSKQTVKRKQSKETKATKMKSINTITEQQSKSHEIKRKTPRQNNQTNN